MTAEPNTMNGKTWQVPAPRSSSEMSVMEFATMHQVYVDNARTPGISQDTINELADGLNRLCAANPKAYAEYLEQQRVEAEVSIEMAGSVAMRGAFFHVGDSVGTQG